MANIGNINIKIGADVTAFTKALTKATKKMDRFANKMKSLGKTLTLSVTAPIVAAGASFVKMAADMETLNTSFETLAGSAEKGQKALEAIKQFSASTPFQFTEIANASKGIIALTGTTKGLVTQMKILGNISSATGSRIGEISQIYLKVVAKGKLQAEELNQFAERSVPIIGAIAEEMGVAQSEVRDLAADGAVTSDIFIRAMNRLGGEGGKFADAMAKQSLTVNGLFSTLKDNVFLLMNEMGTAISDNLNLKDVAAGLIQGVKNLKAVVIDFVSTKPEMTKMILKIAGLAALAGPLLVLVGGFISLAAVTVAAIASLAPLGLAVATVGAAFAGLGLAIQAISGEGSALENLEMAFKSLGITIVEIFANILQIVGAFQTSFFKAINAVINKINTVGQKWYDLKNMITGGNEKFNLFPTIDESPSEIITEAVTAMREFQSSIVNTSNVTTDLSGNYDLMKEKLLKLGEAGKAALAKITEGTSTATLDIGELGATIEETIAEITTQAAEEVEGGKSKAGKAAKTLGEKLGDQVNGGIDDSLAALVKGGDIGDIMYGMFQDLQVTMLQDAFQPLKDTVSTMFTGAFATGTAEATDAASGDVTKSSLNITSLFGETMEGGFGEAFKGISNVVGDLLGGLLDMIGGGLGGLGGLFGSIGGGIGSIFGGFFADGGDPPVGKVSVVGERGPELFVPKGAGTIIPNHELQGSTGGSGETNITMNIGEGVDEKIRSQLQQALPTFVAQATEAVQARVLQGGSFQRNIRG